MTGTDHDSASSILTAAAPRPPEVPCPDSPILFVDDDDQLLAVVQELLQLEGFNVVTTPDPLQAVRWIEARPFAVILTDQQMPRMTGLELLARVKQLQPEATRVLITAVVNLDTVIKAINAGEIYRFIAKPWIREELIATLRNAIQRHDLIRANASLQAATAAMNEKLSRLNGALEAQVRQIHDQNHRLEAANAALAQNLKQSVELCLKTMQSFYPTLASQARRVFEVCKAMADAARLNATDRQVLEISGWLHDVGLVGVPRRLIRKWEQEPAQLDPAERALIELHPVLGQELAGFVHDLEAVGPVIRAHHERFDGKGYPDRLAGENIPWLARLLAPAVAYAASNHDHECTLALLQRESAGAFDPDALRLLLRCIPQASVPRKQRQVLISELRPGMVLARDIYTSTGMLLLPDGQRLTSAYIDKVRSHDRISTINHSLLVYC